MRNDEAATEDRKAAPRSGAVMAHGHRAAAAWAGIGFLTGALFWGAAGTLPGTATGTLNPLPGPAPIDVVGAKLGDRLPADEKDAGVTDASANCVTLILDRRAGPTLAAACRTDPLLQQDAATPGQGRQDLMPILLPGTR